MRKSTTTSKRPDESGSNGKVWMVAGVLMLAGTSGLLLGSISMLAYGMIADGRLTEFLASVGLAEEKAKPAVKKVTVKQVPEATKVPKKPSAEEIRARTWKKIEPHLAKARKEAGAAWNKQVKKVERFFEESRKGTPEVAKALMSWGGQWKYATSSTEDYQKFVRTKMDENVFSSEDLQRVITQSVEELLQQLHTIEGELVVAVLADLEDSDLPQAQGVKISSEKAFREYLRQTMKDLYTKMGINVAGTIGQELTSLVTGEIAARLALHIIKGMAVRLGVKSTLLAGGVAGSAVSFGLTIVAAIVADRIIDWVLRWGGHDPEKDLAARLCVQLGNLEAELVDGDLEARWTVGFLEKQAQTDSVREVCQACRKAIARLERYAPLGLKRDFKQLAQWRHHLWEVALRRMVYGKTDGGAFANPDRLPSLFHQNKELVSYPAYHKDPMVMVKACGLLRKAYDHPGWKRSLLHGCNGQDIQRALKSSKPKARIQAAQAAALLLVGPLRPEEKKAEAREKKNKPALPKHLNKPIEAVEPAAIIPHGTKVGALLPWKANVVAQQSVLQDVRVGASLPRRDRHAKAA